MSNVFKATAVVIALGFGAPAQAAQLSLDLTMNNYYGNRAYLVAYVVDTNGQYVSTLYTAGQRERYLADLSR
jgi:hypothetical protein